MLPCNYNRPWPREVQPVSGQAFYSPGWLPISCPRTRRLGFARFVIAKSIRASFSARTAELDCIGLRARPRIISDVGTLNGPSQTLAFEIACQSAVGWDRMAHSGKARYSMEWNNRRCDGCNFDCGDCAAPARRIPILSWKNCKSIGLRMDWNQPPCCSMATGSGSPSAGMPRMPHSTFDCQVQVRHLQQEPFCVATVAAIWKALLAASWPSRLWTAPPPAASGSSRPRMAPSRRQR